MINFVIAFFSIIILAALHEFGHFLIAKKCGVEIEEFGIGYPPQIFGKQLGDTFYSFNWLPFGAFVKMKGEEEKIDSPTSFSNQSVGKKIWITLGGVISFWLIAILIYSFLFFSGYRVMVQDSNLEGLSDFEIGILEIAESSPAQEGGLQTGDIIEKISFEDQEIFPSKIKDVQEFINSHLGKKVNLLIRRGEIKIEKSITARDYYLEGEGPLGVSLIRTAFQKSSWYSSIWKGINETWYNTVLILRAYGMMFAQIFQGSFKSESLVSAVGIVQMISQSQKFGFSYFFSFLAFLSINLAVFNSLPIPLVDGGRVFFLLVEAIRKESLSEKVLEKINLVSFVFLGSLIIWVTVRDIINLF